MTPSGVSAGWISPGREISRAAVNVTQNLNKKWEAFIREGNISSKKTFSG
jgi:hypothetical protein